MVAEMHAATDQRVFVDIGIPEDTRREIADGLTVNLLTERMRTHGKNAWVLRSMPGD